MVYVFLLIFQRKPKNTTQNSPSEADETDQSTKTFITDATASSQTDREHEKRFVLFCH